MNGRIIKKNMTKISVVINTLNEEVNLPRALTSAKDFADEIIVCDMYSDDQTAKIAEKFGAKVYLHRRTDFVEPARNFAISKATGDWIFVLDADEEIPPSLAESLLTSIKDDSISAIYCPRKNIIFNKWIKNARWWPDYLLRFFKKGKVKWSDKIHSEPNVEGVKIKLLAEESKAIVHYHYTSLDQYLARLIRYTRIQAQELIDSGYQFFWRDLARKPLSEFLSRFFAGEGYKDGIHGLVLSFLQAISEFIVYARVWEQGKYPEKETREIFEEIEEGIHETNWWLDKEKKQPLKKLLWKIKLR